MEEDLVQSLQEVGYEGPLVDVGKLNHALEKGAKSVDFTALVSWLSEQLAMFCNLDEHVHLTASSEDSSTFLLELSSFLKELGCVNSKLTTGNVNQRLATRQERVLLLEYLITELMAGKINHEKNPDTAKLELTIHESDTAKALKEMLIALQFGKPPDNISVDQLFTKLEGKLKTIVASAPADLLGKPLIIGELSTSQWEKLDQLQQDMNEEYRIRREMLLKRLDVTIQSFLWSDRIKKKENEVNYCYREKRKELTTEPSVTIPQLLAARDDIAIIEKTSSASVRKNTKSDVTKVIIGDVPDRGGRANEQAPPPPEMPSWQKDRVQGPGGGGRGGRGGGRGRGGGEAGRGGRGGGRGGYNKDVNTNFGQNNDWQNSSQGSTYQDNRAGGYQGGGSNYQNNRAGEYQGGGGGGGGGSSYQNNRAGDYQRSGGTASAGGGTYYQNNRGANYSDNRGGGGYQDSRGGGGSYQNNQSDYQRGGGGRDSNDSGYNRGRGGRVQGGWSQGAGGGGGYNRGGNRSNY